MLALAMILTAAMAVPGNGPEKVSGEMMEQRLDLSGKWEGTAQNLILESRSMVRFSRGIIDIRGQEGAVGASLKIIDEGKGNLRLEATIVGTVRRSLGIYKWQGDQLVICCCSENKGRPLTFSDEASSLLILRRVKPRK